MGALLTADWLKGIRASLGTAMKRVAAEAILHFRAEDRYTRRSSSEAMR
jgi:hypothetical protein